MFIEERESKEPLPPRYTYLERLFVYIFLLEKRVLNVKRLDVWDGIPAPPLFIEEVSAGLTEEFIENLEWTTPSNFPCVRGSRRE